MADLVVIVPSRGRPENIARLVEAWRKTSLAGAELIVAVDEDDPRLEDYRALELPFLGSLWVGPRRRLGGTLNAVAADVLEQRGAVTGQRPMAIGFMGDDHLPRTEGWDGMVIDALGELGAGVVYGNDLLQGERLPTAAFLTTNIVRALGWFSLPGLVHLYIDNAWMELGRGMGRLRYLPDVVVEHLHPAAGKAPRDALYDEVNSPDQDRHDKAMFEAWMMAGRHGNLETLRNAGLC